MLYPFLLPRATTIYNIQDHSERNWLPAYALTIQVIVTFLVWVRLIGRFSTNGRPGFDDVLIFLAWILGTLMTAVCILSVHRYGFNKHVWDVAVKDWWKGGLVAFIIESLFIWSTCFTKVSVLMFYRRLVQGTCGLKFKWAIWSAIAFVIAYTIAFFVLTFTACQPFVALWQQYNPNWLANDPDFLCADTVLITQLSEIAGALSVITDFYSVMLPALLIFKIRITKRQKYGLLFIFGMGYLVVAAGIARTIYLSRVQAEMYDKSWFAFNIFVASIAECNVAIACACAPSLKTIFGRFFRDMSTRYGSGGNSKISSKTDSNGNKDSRDDHNINSNGSNDAIDKLREPLKTLRAKTSRLKAKIGGNKKQTVDVYLQEDADSFKETHEHRIVNMNPVASGLGDGLVLPMERVFSHEMHHRNSQIAQLTETLRRTSLPTQHLRHLAGQGSNIESYFISPSPSVSSDDEVSLVDERAYHRDGDLPYGLPEREESRLVARPLRNQAQSSAPNNPPQSQRPFPILDLPSDIASPRSENSFYEDHVGRSSTAGSTDLTKSPRTKVRRKSSKEKWNERTTYPYL